MSGDRAPAGRLRILWPAVAVAAAVTAAPAGATAPATKEPGALVVGLSLPSPGFQVGAVRGGEIVLARGLEVDVARALARRLGLRRVRLVQAGSPERLVAAGAKRWDVGLARLSPTPARGRAVDFSVPYLRADLGVLARRGLARPRVLSDLVGLQLCVERGSRGADAVAGRVRPAAAPLRTDDLESLLRLVQTGRCDAAVADATALALALAGRRERYGPLVGRIDTGAAYALALERGSPLLPAVDRALARLAADGALRRLAADWLGVDLARVPVLR